jgi:glycosyltransferase involved in cell wall biosynthesis
MRAAIFNPYLDTLGGGEYYTISFARVLIKLGYKVEFQWKDTRIIEKLASRYDCDLSQMITVKDIKRGDGYDLCFWLSDGSIPMLRARKNYLHFQFPFKDVNGRSLLNKMKFFRINEIVCNSYFTKAYIDKEFGVESIVIYPPVAVDKIKPRKKENIILYVGRFSQLTQAKNQDLLIKLFKKLMDTNISGWRLFLAGGTEIGSSKYFEKLKRLADKLPVELVSSPTYERLLSLYGRAKIFWSAAGYGFDEKTDPVKLEHFGISLVEAMAAGAVPVVYNAGGPKEVIDEGVNGYLWIRKVDLIKKTRKLIEDKKLLTEISQNAVMASRVYENARFYAEVAQIIKGKK